MGQQAQLERRAVILQQGFDALDGRVAVEERASQHRARREAVVERRFGVIEPGQMSTLYGAIEHGDVQHNAEQDAHGEHASWHARSGQKTESGNKDESRRETEMVGEPDAGPVPPRRVETRPQGVRESRFLHGAHEGLTLPKELLDRHDSERIVSGRGRHETQQARCGWSPLGNREGVPRAAGSGDQLLRRLDRACGTA